MLIQTEVGRAEVVAKRVAALPGASSSEYVTGPYDVEKEAAVLEELRRTGQPVHYEKEYRRKDGTRVPVESYVICARMSMESHLITTPLLPTSPNASGPRRRCGRAGS